MLLEPGLFRSCVHRNRVMGRYAFDPDSPYYGLSQKISRNSLSYDRRAGDPLKVARTSRKIVRARNSTQHYAWGQMHSWAPWRPDCCQVSGLDYNPAPMDELQTLAGFLGDFDCSFQGNPVVRGILDQSFNVAAAHQLGQGAPGWESFAV